MSVRYSDDVLEFGLSADELSEGVLKFLAACIGRVQGPGREQYERPRDGHRGVYQAFEHMTPLELVQMAREEVQDLGVYAAMTDIRLARLQAALKHNDVIGDAR